MNIYSDENCVNYNFSTSIPTLIQRVEIGIKDMYCKEEEVQIIFSTSKISNVAYEKIKKRFTKSSIIRSSWVPEENVFYVVDKRYLPLGKELI